ncbi:ift81 cdv1 [Scophthalmus maximus]|uniref:Ift81 cdv1 n=1 Tax=Scophthalmus maximus TaxID=52904 RepID=A0A2U9BR23_SCOMX|nr:ift81 cdv1 [Scophthalmus maximus]
MALTYRSTRWSQCPTTKGCWTWPDKLQVENQREESLTHQKQEQSDQGLMKRLEEEIKFNSFMVPEKLPEELQGGRHTVQYLQEVASEPAMGQAGLQELEDKSKAEELQEVREELAAAEKELRQKSRKTQVSYGEEVILGGSDTWLEKVDTLLDNQLGKVENSMGPQM